MEQLLPWERMLKQIVWSQMGDIADKKILDFGSGFGVTADHYRAIAFFHHVILKKEGE